MLFCNPLNSPYLRNLGVYTIVQRVRSGWIRLGKDVLQKQLKIKEVGDESQVSWCMAEALAGPVLG